ncbi:MAG TPA: calcium/proton exchanger [Solirubrobacteraceae bacterium]|nr:calcium/proton exchanger [Solirubrobacteraceae bacterium]
MRPVFVLGVFVPVAAALHFGDADSSLVFAASALAIVPVAALMGDATEQLSARAGPGVGGLVNVTFGNAPELIIAIFALADGLQEVVKASLVGSILGNCLLVLGAAMFAGGMGRVRQRFSPTAAQALAGMVLVAVVALALPSTLALARHLHLPSVSQVRHGYGGDLEAVSIAVSVVLACTYLAGLVFSLRTHRDLFSPAGEQAEVDAAWPARRSLAVLAGAGVVVALMSELLVGSIEHAAHQIGVSQFFLSAYVVAIVGNAAEHYVAVSAAIKDKMDLSLNIALGSSVQIGLVVTPILVLLSLFVGPSPMAAVFNPYEIAALLAAGLVSAAVVSDGESTWFEGLALIALYLVIGIVFYAA